ncbi:Endoplasmic reticulum membrane-associated oxidoreductin involved in disulfide bond formation [Pseudoloma neurophilia]|uniref:Endoplasmic reticulum membrane-associated oxidoreductin involved in disulfide bond formation n=1 Tax=Pseudoloma neurophilia TaxID=146866 RepID=A0A0R0M2Z6_9MICR|nr:Endoplasmic reticulum membrane-associated oxidoreductin involved in disulfide bond formation [Pseudoloma neurophilia]
MSPFVILMFSLSFCASIYDKAVANQNDLQKRVKMLCQTPDFSLIPFNLSQNCQFPDLMEKCGLFSCLLQDRGTISSEDKTINGTIMVDLLRNPPSNTGYRQNAMLIWSKLANINQTPIYFYFLNGIKQSVDVQICKNYKNVFGFQLSNPRLFKIKFFEKNIRSIQQLKYLMIYALSYFKQVDFIELKSFLLKISSKEVLRTEKIVLDEDFHQKSSNGSKNLNVLLNNPVLNVLLSDLKAVFKILDCIPCEKCRLWAEIQFNGLISVLKILKNDRLTLLEFKYFMILLNKLIQAEEDFHKMSNMMKNYIFFMLLLYFREILTVFAGLFMIYLIFKK